MELKNNAQRGRIILTLFYILGAIISLSIVSDFMQYNLLSTDQSELSFSDLESNDTRQQIIAIFYIGTYILSVIFFIMWFRRAYYNLHQTEAKLQFTEGWAAGAWFVPFLNLVRPYQIMEEIWTETQRQSGSKQYPTVTMLIGIWWGFWILGNGVNRVSSRMARDISTVPELQNATLASMIGDTLTLVALVLIVIIIRKIMTFEVQLFNNHNEVNLTDHLLD